MKRQTWRLRKRAPARRAAPSEFQERSGRRKDRSGPARWSAIAGWNSWLNKILFRPFELLLELPLGAANFVDEFFEPSMILLAGLGFDAASDVDRIGTDGTNGCGDVLNLEAARQNDAVRAGRAARQLPISGLAGAAILTGARAVEEKGEDIGVAIKRSKGEAGVDAKRFDNRERP